MRAISSTVKFMTNSVRRKRLSHSCSGRSFQRSRWFQVHWFLPHHQPRFQTNSTIHAAYQNCMVVAHMHRLQTCVITEAYSHQFTLIHTTRINILLILYLLTTQRWTRESGFDCGHPTNVCHQFDETDANITLHATPPSFAAATWVVQISKKTISVYVDLVKTYHWTAVTREQIWGLKVKSQGHWERKCKKWESNYERMSLYTLCTVQGHKSSDSLRFLPHNQSFFLTG